MNLIETRHYLHQHPEVSGKEEKTAEFIITQLQKLGVQTIHHSFSNTAILAEIKGQKPGKTLLFRCELDALPIQETNTNLSYKSIYKGVGHKCGHDGHMTILLGLAQKLLQKPILKGNVLLLFQPAEEDGRGAKGILNSKKLTEFNIDYIFALHNVPGYPLGSIVCKPGSFTPSVESLDVNLFGKTSHAGMPWRGINPATTMAKLINYYQDLHQPDSQKENYFLATPIQIEMGEQAYGTSAGQGRISYTFRAYDHALFVTQKKEIIEHTTQLIQETKDLRYKLVWKEGFEANINNPQAYHFIKEAAKTQNYPFIEKEIGFSWGEDFGRFTQHYPGAMFGLGAGKNHPDLHNPDYDFPDELIDKGIAMFYEIAQKTTL